MITVPSHDPLTRPGHIHNLGQGSYAHHARSELPGGNCSPVYGSDSFARHWGGVAVGERTGHLASTSL